MKNFAQNKSKYYGNSTDSKKSSDHPKSPEALRILYFGCDIKGIKDSWSESTTTIRPIETKSKTVVTAKPIDTELEKQFSKSAEKWRKETGGYSIMIHIAGNNNYLDIIGMGPAALPFILKDLQNEPDFWFIALNHITKATPNPVPKEHIGDIDKMTEDWLNWGKQNGII